jgi:hypothetical protein
MPYTMADFRRDYVKEHLKDLTSEERLAGLPPEELLAGLSPEQKTALLTILLRDAPPATKEPPPPQPGDAAHGS